jgi:hypothetical protein
MSGQHPRGKPASVEACGAIRFQASSKISSEVGGVTIILVYTQVSDQLAYVLVRVEVNVRIGLDRLVRDGARRLLRLGRLVLVAFKCREKLPIRQA